MVLKDLRRNKGYSQQKLSAISGVSYYKIVGFESGDRDLTEATIGTVHKLAEALGCSMDYLLEWEQLEEDVIASGIEEYNDYIQDGHARFEAEAMISNYLYTRFWGYKDTLNLDKLTRRVLERVSNM